MCAYLSYFSWTNVSNNPQLNQKRMVHLKILELEPEQEEHSHSLFHQYSTSQSNHNKKIQKKSSPCNLPNYIARSPPQPFGIFFNKTRIVSKDRNATLTIKFLISNVKHQPLLKCNKIKRQRISSICM